MNVKLDTIAVTGYNAQRQSDSLREQTNTKLFQSNITATIGDTVNITEKKSIIEKKEEKKSNTKKWLIAAGITLGAIAIGVATYCLTKKASTKLPKTIAGDLPETLAKMDDFDIFKDLKMCKNLSMEEKKAAYNILIKHDNKDIFLGTLSGNKPMSLLSAAEKIDNTNGNPLDILKKLDIGDNIAFVKGNHWSDGRRLNFFNDYAINKKSLFNVIKNNKDLYTSRLNLDKKASIEEIYETLVNLSKKNNGLPDDLLGVSLGFPKYDSMIFNLEKFISPKKNRSAPDYIEKLLETLKKEDFPYRNVDKKTLQTLENYIKNIDQKKLKNIGITGSYHDGLYEFINFCDDTKELERIAKSTANYKQTFSIV